MARGEHIKVKRCRGLYSHHGIDMGDGTVIHFSGEPLHRQNARICRVSLREFLAGGTLELVRHREAGRTLAASAEAAEAALTDRAYCLWRNNCEHFASWCRTGRHESGQVRRALRVAGGVAGATLAVIVPLVVARHMGRTASD